MKITRTAVPVDVTVSYYYNGRRADGERDTSWNRPGPTKSGPVYDKVKALVLGNRGIMKPSWREATQWGYSYADGPTSATPGDFPAFLEFTEKYNPPKPSTPSFRKRRAAGEIVVSSHKRSTRTLHFASGSYDDYGNASDPFQPGWSTNNTNPENASSPWKLEPSEGEWVGNHFVWSVTWNITYQLIDRKSNVHPYEVGFPRDYEPYVPPFGIDGGLVTEALAKANSGTYDLLTEIAELPSTLDYLGGKVKASVSLIREYEKKEKALKRLLSNKNRKIAEKAAKSLASLWLQFRYAIMPLVYSIEDIKKTLEAYQRIFAKFTTKDVEDLIIDVPGWKTNGGPTSTKRCFIKRSFDPKTLVDQLLGVLKVNPFSTAWELVTLSFVVDWFFNIGNVISAFTAEPDYTSQGSCFSRKIDGGTRYTLKGYSGSVSANYTVYHRVVIEPRDWISLQFKPEMDWKRWLDAISLGLSPTLKALKGLRK